MWWRRLYPWSWPGWVQKTTILLLVLITLGGGSVFGYLLLRGQILIAEFEMEGGRQASRILDRYGAPIATFGPQARTLVSTDEVSPHLVQAILAIEDTRFYRHRGLDLWAILRSIIVDLRQRDRAQGGSTITQQLAKNVFLTPEKSFRRKAEEAVLAILLERKYTKDEILAFYLNSVFYGDGAYGIYDAAQTYFQKHPSELNLEESALLAGVLQAPSFYSPSRHPQRATQRRNVVLARMRTLEMIDETTYQRAQATPLLLNHAPTSERQAPYFVDYLLSQLEDWMHSTGLVIHTTLDPQLQSLAENLLGEAQGAIVVLDPRNGEILAMVGGRDYQESQFNRAIQAHRQPGSAFKPFIYAAALSQGYTQASLFQDTPTTYGTYRPTNFNDRYQGPITLRQALIDSANVVAVSLLAEVGIPAALRTARDMGIESLTPEDNNLALALGGLSQGTTPLEMAAAYQALANGGFWYRPHGIQRIEDEQGQVLQLIQPTGRRAISPQVAYLVTDMLQASIEQGTGRQANPGRPAAGKTGTTNNLVDAWFVGYTPQVLAAIYIGNDDNTPVGGTGGSLAAPLFARLVREGLAGRPAVEFSVPSGLVTQVPICVSTGQPPTPGCSRIDEHSFIAGTEPAPPPRVPEFPFPWPFPVPEDEEEEPEEEAEEEDTQDDEEEFGDPLLPRVLPRRRFGLFN